MVLINTKMFVMSYRCLYLVLNTFGESLNPFMAFSINFRNFPLIKLIFILANRNVIKETKVSLSIRSGNTLKYFFKCISKLNVYTFFLFNQQTYQYKLLSNFKYFKIP